MLENNKKCNQYEHLFHRPRHDVLQKFTVIKWGDTLLLKVRCRLCGHEVAMAYSSKHSEDFELDSLPDEVKNVVKLCYY